MTDQMARPQKVAAALAEMDDLLDGPDVREVEPRRRNTRTRVLQVRLTDDEFARVQARAEALGVPLSTVGRDLILGGISEDGGAVAALIAAMHDHGLRVVPNESGA